MSVRFIQPSFAAGELSPSMWGRVDVAKYHIGLSTMRNLFVSYRGGAYSRAGTKFVGFSAQSGRTFPPRLITFQFSINQGLALEFGNLYMRVISDGAFVTESPTAITGITNANPGVVTDVAHGYVTGDWLFFASIGGMIQLNGQTLIAVVIDADHYSLTDIYGNAIDTTTFGAYTSGGTAARIYTLPTPWAEADLEWLKFTQSADTMSICNWNQDTLTEYAPYDLARLSDDDWTLTKFGAGTSIGPPSACSGSATVTTATKPTDYQYVTTAVDRSTGEESVQSPIADIPNSVDIAITAGSIELAWTGVSGAGFYNIYKAPPAYNSSVPAGSLFGYAGSSYGTNFVDSNIVPDFTQVPPLHLDPFAGGQIVEVNILTPGSDLDAVTYNITTSTGSGFLGFGVVENGQMVAFVVLDPGEGYLPGDSIAFNGAGFASGAVTYTANPLPGDTVTLNGITWEMVSAITGANQTLIQGALSDTIRQLASDLSASGIAGLLPARYSSQDSGGDSILNIVYKTAGVGGDAYTLAVASGGGTATVSGPNLTGGAGTGGTAPTGTLVIGPNTGTFPGTVAYFQERRVYASTENNPDTYFMSQPGAFYNFDARTPTIPSDAITGTPWSVEVNGIQSMIPMPGGLVTFTGLGAWQISGAGSSPLNPQAITPASQEAEPQSFGGCNNKVPPIRIDQEIFYVQSKGSIWRDLAYNFWTAIYTGTDLTYLSSHLFTGYQTREAAWCEEPYRIVWAVRNDNVLLSLTTMKQQEVNGWARHDTNGLWWSICAVTEPPVDALYLVSQRFPPA